MEITQNETDGTVSVVFKSMLLRPIVSIVQGQAEFAWEAFITVLMRAGLAATGR
jgi:hypothetical protein